MSTTSAPQLPEVEEAFKRIFKKDSRSLHSVNNAPASVLEVMIKMLAQAMILAPQKELKDIVLIISYVTQFLPDNG